MRGPSEESNGPDGVRGVADSAGTDASGIRWLLAANLLTLALALWQGSSVAALLWPYWFQSLAIGWFHARRIRALGAFSTRGLSQAGRRVPETEAAKRSTANFFLLHYGGFHLAYGVFLLAFAMPEPAEWRWILIAVPALVLAQARLHSGELAVDARGRPSLALMMVAPYVRAVPMHLILCVGAFVAPAGTLALVATVAIKTLGDLATQRVERRILTPADPGSASGPPAA
jgi:hypothetical protein